MYYDRYRRISMREKSVDTMMTLSIRKPKKLQMYLYLMRDTALFCKSKILQFVSPELDLVQKLHDNEYTTVDTFDYDE